LADVKLLHTSITVKDMDSSIHFYTEHFGMKLIRRREVPENNAEIAFLGFEGSEHQIELTHWRGKKDYVEGDQLDHLAFQVANLDSEIKKLKQKRVEIAKEPFALHGSSRRIAFIKDVNGIWIELIEDQ
jgi:lactoylglutathione lyase